jgi:hypothetical protein
MINDTRAMILGIMTFSITTLSIITFGMITLSVTTLLITINFKVLTTVLTTLDAECFTVVCL